MLRSDDCPGCVTTSIGGTHVAPYSFSPLLREVVDRLAKRRAVEVVMEHLDRIVLARVAPTVPVGRHDRPRRRPALLALHMWAEHAVRRRCRKRERRVHAAVHAERGRRIGYLVASICAYEQLSRRAEVL